MTEELLDETAYRRADDSGQEGLIAVYCGDIEDRISSARTADAAKLISDEACRTFRKECTSTLIGRALTDHVAGLYERYWGNEN